MNIKAGIYDLEDVPEYAYSDSANKYPLLS